MSASASLSGHTCGNCGAWVPYGSFHSCPTTVPQTPSVTVNPDPTQLRIAMALERIASALEKVAVRAAAGETSQ